MRYLLARVIVAGVSKEKNVAIVLDRNFKVVA